MTDSTEDAGRILEYLYLHKGDSLTQQTLFDASDLSRDEIRDALDHLEERMLVDLGLSPEDAPYEDIAITEKGVDMIETVGAFSDEFDASLDLNRIAREWDTT